MGSLFVHLEMFGFCNHRVPILGIEYVPPHIGDHCNSMLLDDILSGDDGISNRKGNVGWICRCGVDLVRVEHVKGRSTISLKEQGSWLSGHKTLGSLILNNQDVGREYDSRKLACVQTMFATSCVALFDGSPCLVWFRWTRLEALCFVLTIHQSKRFHSSVMIVIIT
uniref:Uncharacterized protein n=1 Tax=Lactuca sativa TaxID=4236 RepID=A0A9R1UHX1_LACSA|nr:hypothetical protein LSAT_V11C900469630 [Lactuca sativa]